MWTYVLWFIYGCINKPHTKKKLIKKLFNDFWKYKRKT